MERLVAAPRRPPRAAAKPPVDDAADAPALVGQLLAGRQVDARELEQRDAARCRRPRSSRRPRRARASSVVRRIAWSPLIGSGSRIALRVGIGRDEAPGVRLAEARRRRARPRRRRRSRCSRRQVPGDRAPERHRARDAVEHDARDLLDDVDLARHVARAPGRDGDVPVVARPRSRAARGSSAARRRRPRGRRSASRALGPQA